MEVPAQRLLEILIVVPVAAVVGAITFFGVRALARISQGQRPHLVRDPGTEIERIKAKDRADARALYERVTKDKLEVIKTALAMGYSRQDLQQLDERLEGLIGSEKLHNLIESDSPTAPSLKGELLDADLVQQIENLMPEKKERD